ncbi:16S rRNA (guanine(527)-N(7))-methyltransferase RsmG [Clostridium folliculivorans]|uniref:Ribosomal RNA small subunit methyltransferase G n=1 Tax=Clostridium folliculivorans TaxID=2886038 RepID=A0A9W5Y3E0_9CLOT|nr:16S rRNA (guanine(527)-N(7))-methyltransferase RsmG [Clostridium folliculivorans]GKU25823.1 ribosomal RNA small subunit methyltransferase G [Clostridium folliculivorans]GKU27909.1 ribosomal RNA small subunit methyltransferase G [Clostridium folliculivorans]
MIYYSILEKACTSVGVEFNEDKYEKFMIYMSLLKEWNEKINLTAITEDDQIVKKHFVDSIKAFNSPLFKSASSLIDVGTGAGFPGIPIAIIREELNVTLLDSLNKRVSFLNEVIQQLHLDNVKTIHSRAEDGARNKDLREKFDIATSRAVANMCVLSEFCIPYVRVNGHFIALKGPSIEDELDESRNAVATLGGKLVEVIQVNIEETDLKHNLVVVKKIKETPKTYPRKAGSISKKPIK